MVALTSLATKHVNRRYKGAHQVSFIRPLSAKFLKCGNKRDGDSGDDLWVGVPTPRAWLAG